MQYNELYFADISARLSQEKDFWAYWGFEPWQKGSFIGVCRKQNFVKSGILGKVAEFYATDYIVWECGTEEEREVLWKELFPQKEVMTQRFLFLRPGLYRKRRVRSFLFGLKGFAEFYSFWPGEKHNVPKDLSGLIQLALEVKEKRDLLGEKGEA